MCDSTPTIKRVACATTPIYKGGSWLHAATPTTLAATPTEGGNGVVAAVMEPRTLQPVFVVFFFFFYDLFYYSQNSYTSLSKLKIQVFIYQKSTFRGVSQNFL